MGYFFVFCARNAGVKMTAKTVTIQTSSIYIHCKIQSVLFFFFTIVSTIIGVLLSAISLSAELRVFFFFSRVRFSLAVSKVIQAHITSFLIDPSLDSQAASLEKLLSSVMQYGY
jgi:hypothetical protein